MTALLAGLLAGLAVWYTGRPSARAGPLPRPNRAPGASTLEARRGEQPRAWLPAAAAVPVAVGVAAFVGGVPGLAVGAPAGLLAWLAVLRMEAPEARRRREALESGLSHVADLLGACLYAGQSPAPALREIARAVGGPMAEELEALVHRLRLGVDPVTVWREAGRHPQLGPLGRCVSRAVDSGASIADAMTRLADDLRREARLRVEGRARSVGVKAAMPLGLCMLPAFVLVGVVPLVVGSLSALTTR